VGFTLLRVLFPQLLIRCCQTFHHPSDIFQMNVDRTSECRPGRLLVFAAASAPEHPLLWHGTTVGIAWLSLHDQCLLDGDGVTLAANWPQLVQ